ncbi:hypothetical protein D030_0129A, partial [Vibrio parahaemolyticus AQ3810]
MRYFCIP